jgi:hypothetical protein
MRKAMLLAALVLSGAATLFAETWTGYLVDSKCYAAEERNVNPHDPTFNTNHDRGYQVLFCRPKARTTSFAIVDYDGYSFELDAPGNTKAANLVRQTKGKGALKVKVTGEKQKQTLIVDSISPAE